MVQWYNMKRKEGQTPAGKGGISKLRKPRFKKFACEKNEFCEFSIIFNM